MWRVLQFSYKNAFVLLLLTGLITAFFGYYIQNIKIRVSSDELIPEGSDLQAQYDKVREKFGSDEVAVVYVESEDLFDRERLLQMRTLNRDLTRLRAVERVESLFTVSNIRGDGGMVDTSPLLDRIPRSDKRRAAKKQHAIDNPILLRNVISEDGNATIYSLYLRDPHEMAELAAKRIEKIDSQFEAWGITTAPATEAAKAPKVEESKPQPPTAPNASVRPQLPQVPGAPNAPPRPGATPSGAMLEKKVAELKAERAKWEPYLIESKFAENVYEDIEALLVDNREGFDQMYQVGSPAVQVYMTDFIMSDQKILLPLSGVVLVILIGFMLQSFQGAIIPVMNAAISAVWTIGAMALFDVPINMLNYIVPVLILVIGATEDVHILVEYRESLARGLRKQAAIVDVGHHIGLTLALTGVTTVLGFAATGITDIKIMRDFGITAALGMFSRFIVSVTFLPAYLRLVGWMFKPASQEEHQNSWSVRATNAFAKLVMTKIVPYPVKSISIFLAIVIPCAFFATQIKLSNDLISFLKQDSQLVQELDRLSENLSGSKVIYLTLHGNEGDYRTGRKLREIAHISNYLRSMGEFDTVNSLADYLALVNREMYGGAEEHHKVPENDALIAQYLLFFHHSQISPYVSGDFSEANIVIRCNINDSSHLNEVMHLIREDLNKGKFGAQLFTLTGKSVMVADSVDQLSTGQAMSIGFMAFTLFIIIATLFISVKAALLSVVCNLFAIIVLFGIMGAFGIPLNVGTCMVAAITIGIGIDDTLHLMVRYNQELKVLKEEWAAMEMAIRAEFIPVLVTSLGLAGGFLVLGTSSFVPVMQFGLLSAVVIFVTVVADLILTPVLLSTTRLITIWDLVGLNLRKQLMTTSPVFKGMNPTQAKKLILASNVEEYTEGTKLIKAGETGDSMYVILEGELEVSIQQGERRILLSYLSMGEVFGEIALISKMKRTADVTAKTDAKLLVYNWESLVRLRRFAPYLSSQLLLNLANILGKRLVDAQRKVESTTRAPFARKTSTLARKRTKL